jgi:hypothetical protein
MDCSGRVPRRIAYQRLLEVSQIRLHCAAVDHKI